MELREICFENGRWVELDKYRVAWRTSVLAVLIEHDSTIRDAISYLVSSLLSAEIIVTTITQLTINTIYKI